MKKIKENFKFIFICFLIGFAQNIFASDVTIYSNSTNASNATIRETGSSFGNHNIIMASNEEDVGGGVQGEYRELLKFDTFLDEADGATSVTLAKLRMHCWWSDQPGSVYIGRSTTSWTPGTATWAANRLYESYGISQYVANQSSVFSSPSSSDLYEWDVTDIINDWLNGTHDHNGFVVFSQYRGSDAYKRFFSPHTFPGNSNYDAYRPILFLEGLAGGEVIPEPSSMILLGLGIVGLIRKRFKK